MYKIIVKVVTLKMTSCSNRSFAWRRRVNHLGKFKFGHINWKYSCVSLSSKNENGRYFWAIQSTVDAVKSMALFVA